MIFFHMFRLSGELALSEGENVTKRYIVVVEGRNRMRYTFCIHRRVVVTWRRFFEMFAVKTRVRVLTNE